MNSLLLWVAFQSGLLLSFPDMGAGNIPKENRPGADIDAEMPESRLPGKWLSSLEEGQKFAEEFNVPLILHFEATWCGPCRQMASTVLNQPDVVQQLSRSVVGVRIDADHQPDLISRFGVSSLPTEIVLSADGKELARYQGGASLSSYVARLQSLPGIAPAKAETAVAKAELGNSAGEANVVQAAASAEQAPASIASPDPVVAQAVQENASGDNSSGAAAPSATSTETADTESADEEKLRSCLIVQRDGKTVGLGGYSPVALMSQKVWEQGSEQFVASFEGVDYFFRSNEERETFNVDPKAYIPQLHGCDPVEFYQDQRAEVGSIEFGAFYKGQLFFFASIENRRRFQQNPDWYASRMNLGEHQGAVSFPFLNNSSLE